MNNLIKKENNSFYSKELSIFEVDNQNDIGIIENTSILKNKVISNPIEIKVYESLNENVFKIEVIKRKKIKYEQ